MEARAYQLLPVCCAYGQGRCALSFSVQCWCRGGTLQYNAPPVSPCEREWRLASYFEETAVQ